MYNLCHLDLRQFKVIQDHKSWWVFKISLYGKISRHLKFLKHVILDGPCLANIRPEKNVVQIGPEIAEIQLFMYFRDGSRPPY